MSWAWAWASSLASHFPLRPPSLSHAHLLHFAFSGCNPAATFLFSEPYATFQAHLPDLPALSSGHKGQVGSLQIPNSKAFQSLLFILEPCTSISLFSHNTSDIWLQTCPKVSAPHPIPRFSLIKHFRCINILQFNFIVQFYSSMVCKQTIFLKWKALTNSWQHGLFTIYSSRLFITHFKYLFHLFGDSWFHVNTVLWTGYIICRTQGGKWEIFCSKSSKKVLLK